MVLDDMSLSDLNRLLETILRTGGEDTVRKLINHTPPQNLPNGRVTIGTLRRLLVQLNGRTVLTDRIVELLAKDDEDLEQTLVGGTQAVETWVGVKEIMGRNAISLDETEKTFRFSYTEFQRGQLTIIPWSAETLRACADTHVLFPGYPLTIAEMIKRQPIVNIWFGHAERTFVTQEKVELRWYLMRKGAMPYSVGRKFTDQLTLLSPQEEVPRACELMYGLALVKLLVSTDPIFHGGSARCESMSIDDYRVIISEDDSGIRLFSSGTPDGGTGNYSISSMMKAGV